MGPVALAACVCFTVALFVLDKSRNGKPLGALWLPLLYMLIQASRPIVLWLHPGGSETDVSDSSLVNSLPDTIFLLSLFAGGLFVLAKRKLNWSLLIRQNIWLFLFFLYCGISFLWSDFPIITLKAWVKVMVLPVMALVIVTDNSIADAFKTVVKRTAYILLPLSIVLIKYYPAYGRFYTTSGGASYGGVTTFKNGLGILCMFTGLYLFWDLIHMWRDKTRPSGNIPILVNISLLGIIIWLMTYADSATSLTTLIIGSLLLLMLNLSISKSKAGFIKAGLIITVCISGIVVFFPSLLEGVASVLGRDSTLTGRTVIWERVLGVSSNPILGTGYSSFWYGERALQLLDINRIPLNQAHNGYLELYKNLGLAGLTLLALTIIRSISNASTTLLQDSNFGELQITYMTVVLLSNITEASFSIKSVLWFLFVLISIQYLSIQKKSEPRNIT